LKVDTSFQSLAISTNFVNNLLVRLKLERDKEHFHYLLPYYFDSKKTTIEAHQFISETYSESASSVKTYEYWFRRFKSDDFDLKDKEHSDQSKCSKIPNCRHCWMKT